MSDGNRDQTPKALRRLALGMSMALAASGRTQRQVADLCGISTAYLSKMLSGIKNPSQKILADYAGAVRHTVGEIYDLGDLALEREAEADRRDAVERAQREKTVASVLEVADHLELEDLDKLIKGLERKRARHRMPTHRR